MIRIALIGLIIFLAIEIAIHHSVDGLSLLIITVGLVKIVAQMNRNLKPVNVQKKKKPAIIMHSEEGSMSEPIDPLPSSIRERLGME